MDFGFVEGRAIPIWHSWWFYPKKLLVWAKPIVQVKLLTLAVDGRTNRINQTTCISVRRRPLSLPQHHYLQPRRFDRMNVPVSALPLFYSEYGSTWHRKQSYEGADTANPYRKSYARMQASVSDCTSTKCSFKSALLNMFDSFFYGGQMPNSNIPKKYSSLCSISYQHQHRTINRNLNRLSAVFCWASLGTSGFKYLHPNHV